MGGLAPTHYKTLEKFVLHVGCRYVRQKGSHRIYWREGLQRPVILPTYRNVPPFVIRNILRQLGIRVEDFLRLLKEL